MRPTSNMKWLWTILLAGWVVVLSASAEPELKNGIAAIVNDGVITYQEVEDYTGQALELLQRTYFNQPEVFNQKRIEITSNGLEDLVIKQLVLFDFKTSGGQIPDSVIDDEIKDRIRQRFGDRVTLTKTLKAEGITYETFRQRTHDEIIVTYMRQKNVSSAILISPQKIEHAYSTNAAKYQLGDQVKLRMIVLNRPVGGSVDEAKSLAQEILVKVKEGASFADMASIYSEGSQRREGGDWGWREASRLNKGLAEIAFALQPGENSGVLALAKDVNESYWMYRYGPDGQITTARKYTDRDVFVEERKPGKADAADQALPAPQEFYLMLVEDRRGSHVRPLSEVRDEIEKELIVQERDRLQKKWGKRLKDKSFIRYF